MHGLYNEVNVNAFFIEIPYQVNVVDCLYKIPFFFFFFEERIRMYLFLYIFVTYVLYIAYMQIHIADL